MDDLLTRIAVNGITEDNFRPTILVEGAGAYDEDHWELIKVGDVVFEVVKPCTRGMSTTVNQQLGTRNQDREPLATLEKYSNIWCAERGDDRLFLGTALLPRPLKGL